MKKRQPRLTFQNREERLALRADLRAAATAAVMGAAPGEKCITTWDKVRAAVRAAER